MANEFEISAPDMLDYLESEDDEIKSDTTPEEQLPTHQQKYVWGGERAALDEFDISDLDIFNTEELEEMSQLFEDDDGTELNTFHITEPRKLLSEVPSEEDESARAYRELIYQIRAAHSPTKDLINLDDFDEIYGPKPMHIHEGPVQGDLVNFQDSDDGIDFNALKPAPVLTPVVRKPTYHHDLPVYGSYELKEDYDDDFSLNYLQALTGKSGENTRRQSIPLDTLVNPIQSIDARTIPLYPQKSYQSPGKGEMPRAPGVAELVRSSDSVSSSDLNSTVIRVDSQRVYKPVKKVKKVVMPARDMGQNDSSESDSTSDVNTTVYQLSTSVRHEIPSPKPIDFVSISDCDDEDDDLYLDQVRRKRLGVILSQPTVDMDAPDDPIMYKEEIHFVESSDSIEHLKDKLAESKKPRVVNKKQYRRSVQATALATIEESPSAEEGSLRQISVPQDTAATFLKLASQNTAKNVETCGILAGQLAQNRLNITHVIVPKQNGTANSCTATNEEEIFDIQNKKNLITLGWIHVSFWFGIFWWGADYHA